ncbi:hypothetical protein SAMN02983003_0172 [Devosia enhydra]|uniref:Uncharacterized protein n=1 Tax=Devosia enhydra TaxID=665118 RepID=A0A1K2HSF0_9HYPH|nr:hypothetical protein [Devosia enhydra]SFZ80856.1 hypothetical protein SAMN02983003_0172 [Devosia enhydra]
MSNKAMPNLSDPDIEEDQTLADFARAARKLAANVLRLVAGGGNVHQLAENVSSLYDAMDRYHDVHHAYPSQRHWNQALDVDKDRYEVRYRGGNESPGLDSVDEGQRLAFDRTIEICGMRKGLFQMAAAMLIQQRPQTVAGEQKFYENLRLLGDLEERTREHHQPCSRS